MIKATQAALVIFLLTAAVMTGWCGYALHGLIAGADLRMNSKTGILARAEGVEQKAFSTLDNADKATKIWADSAKTQAGAVQDLATDAHGTLSVANRAIEGVNPVTAALTGEIGDLRETTTAATGATLALSGVLTRAQATTEGATATLARTATAISDLDTLLKDQAIQRTMAARRSALEDVHGMSTDGRKVADALTVKFLTPVPWWKQPITKGGELIDIAAAIARHAP